MEDVIIAHTVPDQGVSFMEHDYKWHGVTLKPEEAEKDITELMAQRKELMAAS